MSLIPSFFTVKTLSLSKVKWSGLVGAGISAKAGVRACGPGVPCSSLSTTAQDLAPFVIVCSYKMS